MSYTYPYGDGQSTAMDHVYDSIGYPYINSQNDDNSWSAPTTYLNHKLFPTQQIEPQAYLTQYNNLGAEWVFFDHERSHRYMSPSDTYSSSRSEVSSPHDTSSAASITHYPLAYSPCVVDTVNPLAYEAVVKQMNIYQMPVTERDNTSHMPFDTPEQIFPFTSQAHPIKDFELDFKDEDEPDEEVIRVHSSHVTPQISMPQEVEFSTGTATPMQEITPRQGKRTWQSESDDEHDVGYDDNIAIDDIADSDYADKPKPKRRRSGRGSTSRTSKQAGHQRFISNTTSPKKGLQQSSPTVAVREVAPLRQRRQPLSKQKKLPKFINKAAQVTIEKKDRSFPCTFRHFGCQSVFPNKNEWRRHVACQHLQLGFYRCPLGDCNPENTVTLQNNNRSRVKKEKEEEKTVVYNDFNRKDLFTQHARRMHGPSRNPSLCSTPPTKKGILQPTKNDELAFEQDLLEIRRQCWTVRRNAPSRSNCGICNKVFDAAYCTEFVGKSHSGGSMSQGPGERQSAEERAWEERMEHIGRHYEKMDCTDSEPLDEDLCDWGIETGVLIKLPDGRPWLANTSLPGETSQEGSDVQEGARRTRRQPSRTVIRQSIKKEDEITDEQAVTDEEDAPGDSE